MSIKQVVCPKCGTAMNVMATMASVQCPSCGNVLSTGQYPAANASPAPAPAQSGGAQPSTDEKQPADDNTQLIVFSIVGAVAVVLIFVGGFLAAMNFVGDGSAERAAIQEAERVKAAERQARVEADYRVYDPVPEGEPPYRDVNLPEATKKKLYREYKQLIATSFGKASRIPRSGKIGQELRSSLAGIADREIARFCVIHDITKEDFGQIIAEGDTKGWN